MSLSYIKYIFSFILVSCAFALNAQGQQQGVIDTTFNPGDHGYDYGKGTEDSHWPSEMVQAIGIQSDGKIILGGGFDFYNSKEVNGIVRTFPDGRIDTSFKSGSGLNGTISDLQVDTNDNVYITGSFTSYNGLPILNVAKLLPNGTLDTNFNTGTGAAGSVTCIAIQGDGKLVVGGNFSSFNGVNLGRLVRLNTNGSVDTSYVSGLGANSWIRNLALQPDGKCIIVGDLTTFNNMNAPRIARLNLDGTLDSAFMSNVGIGFTSPSYTPSTTGVGVQANGRIIVAGSFLGFNNTTANGMVRLYPNGIRDASFNPSSTGWMRTVEVLPNQFFIISGSANNIDGHSSNDVYRFKANGDIDTNFAVNDINGDIRVTKTQSNYRVLVGGQVQRFGNSRNIFRVRPNGTLDTTFNLVTGFDGGVTQIHENSDGSLLMVGGFKEYNKKRRNRIVKTHPNGSIDTAFSGSFSGTTFTIAEQDSGKTLIGGAFFDYNNQGWDYIVRIDQNGDYDYSFLYTFYLQTSSFPYEIVVQPNQKILMGGYFSANTNFTYHPFYRLNADGSLDNTFNRPNLNGSVRAVELMPDNKIIIGGDFPNLKRIARLFPNGIVDNSFAVGSGANDWVMDIKRQYDGKLFVCGYFDQFNGQAVGHVVRLNQNGEIDSTFNTGSGADTTVLSISLQSDEKVILTGFFSSFNGYPCNGVVRLHNDGTVDSSFYIGDGANDYVLTSTILQNGDIMIGGGFTAYQGVGRNRIARLAGDSCIVKRTTNTIMACDSYTWIDGNTYTSSVFGPNLVYQGANGCDSVHYLNLTIDTLNARIVLSGYSLISPGTADSYQWIDCTNDSVIPGANGQLFNPQKNGTYAVIVTRGACIDTSSCLTVSGIGFNEHADQTPIRIFPNPASQTLIIESTGQGTYQIISSVGQVCLQGDLSDEVENIDVSVLPPGIYTVVIDATLGRFSRKIVITRR